MGRRPWVGLPPHLWRRPKADRGRDGPKATPPSEPDGRFSRIRLSG